MIELIIIMETTSQNLSDWMYIKSTLDYFYEPRTYGISKIFAGSKSKLIQQDENIKSKIKNTERTPIVILCADYDRDETLNKHIIDYCNKNSYQLIWMNLDIEDVYLGKQIKNSEKSIEAINFQRKKDNLLPKLSNLNCKSPLQTRHTSNILCIFDQFLKRK